MAPTIGKTSPQTSSSPTVPTVPTAEAWRAMTPAEQMAFQLRVIDALSDPAVLMSEGQPHRKTKARSIDALGLHFRTMGRVVYLAEELAVLYPGEKPFSPDILAVLGVEQPEDDERMSWVVVDEGKGLDLVIEVLHRGDRDKDLVENVERYAHLGIPEYFVYDRARQQIHGYRLPSVAGSTAARYQRIVPQLGHYHSNVLDVDLVILDNNLHFLVGEAELPGSADLISRLQGLLVNVEARAEEAQTQAQRAEAQAAARALLTVLRIRGVEVSSVQRERVLAENDVKRIERWLEKAIVAASLAEVLDEPS
ncbi:MAG: Uma2 family endonuclease [Byssovorax sp.]